MTDIHIVTGFLGSGKTRLINHLLNNMTGRVLVLQSEWGRTAIESMDDRLKLERAPKGSLDKVAFVDTFSAFKPDTIVIEHNGMFSTRHLLKELMEIRNEHGMHFKIKSVVHLVRAVKDESMRLMLHELTVENVEECDCLVLDNDPETCSSAQKFLVSVGLEPRGSTNASLRKEKMVLVSEEGHYEGVYDHIMRKKLSLRITEQVKALLPLVLAGSLLWLMAAVGGQNQTINYMTRFVGIVYQAVPFLMLGVIVSSMLHVLVSQEMIEKIFMTSRIRATMISLFGGLFLPVCDCAIVPVTSSLIKKGVPSRHAFAFMLSGPLINPIVLGSTWFAFSDQPVIVVYRALGGVLIAFLASIILSKVIKTEDLIDSDVAKGICDCGSCALETAPEDSRIIRIIRHASEEFVQVAPYLVVGAAVTIAAQVWFAEGISSLIGSNPSLSLFFMMAFSFVLSVCSSSDAFIARGMVDVFGTPSVMGFLILGAMVDLKNVIMLGRILPLTKIIQLVAIVTGVAFVVISIINLIVWGGVGLA